MDIDLKKPTADAILGVMRDEGGAWYEMVYGANGFKTATVEEVESAVEIKLYYGETQSDPPGYEPIAFMAELSKYLLDLRERLHKDFDTATFMGDRVKVIGLRVTTKTVIYTMGSPDADISCTVCGTPTLKRTKAGWCADCDATMDSRHERLVTLNEKSSEQLEKARKQIEEFKVSVNDWVLSRNKMGEKYIKAKKKIELLELENKALDEDRQRANQSAIELREMLHESQSAIEKLQAALEALEAKAEKCVTMVLDPPLSKINITFGLMEREE